MLSANLSFNHHARRPSSRLLHVPGCARSGTENVNGEQDRVAVAVEPEELLGMYTSRGENAFYLPSLPPDNLPAGEEVPPPTIPSSQYSCTVMLANMYRRRSPRTLRWS